MTNIEEPGVGRIAVAAHVLSRTLRRVAEFQAGLESLPASEFDVLEFVGAHPDTTVSEVARALRLQTSNVSATVRALVGRGLLERVTDLRDQRRIRLRTSETARGHRALLDAAWSRQIELALEEMSEVDAAAVRSAAPALSRLAEVVLRGPVAEPVT